MSGRDKFAWIAGFLAFGALLLITNSRNMLPMQALIISVIGGGMMKGLVQSMSKPPSDN